MGERLQNGIIVPDSYIDIEKFPWLTDPNWIIPNMLFSFIVLFLCCICLWYVENRSEQFIKKYFESWIYPIVNKIKARREYVVKRNLAKQKPKSNNKRNS